MVASNRDILFVAIKVMHDERFAWIFRRLFTPVFGVDRMDRFEYRYRINGHIHVRMYGPTSTLEANCPRLRVFTLFLHLHTRRATYSMAMHAGCIPLKELTKRWCIYEATPVEFISVQRSRSTSQCHKHFRCFLQHRRNLWRAQLFVLRLYNFHFCKSF